MWSGKAMAKICPETNEYVLYLDCQECESRQCMNIGEKQEQNEEKSQ